MTGTNNSREKKYKNQQKFNVVSFRESDNFKLKSRREKETTKKETFQTQKENFTIKEN